MKFLRLCVVAMSLIPISIANAGTLDSPRLQAVNKIFETLQIGVAYHKHCVSSDDMPNETFVMNMNVIISLISQELLKIKEDITKEDMARIIGYKTAGIHKVLDKIHSDSNCTGQAIEKAKSIYDYYSGIDSSTQLINQIESLTKKYSE